MMASKARVRASDLLADLVSLRERKFELEDAANAEEEKSQVKVRENERSEAKAADLSSAQHVSKASSLLPLQSCSNMQQLDALSEVFNINPFPPSLDSLMSSSLLASKVVRKCANIMSWMYRMTNIWRK